MEVIIPIQEIHFNSKITEQQKNFSDSSNTENFSCDPFEFHGHSYTAPASPTADVVSSTLITDSEEDDFAFDFSGHLDKNGPPPELTAADELFYKGKIRPLKFPLHLCSTETQTQIPSDPLSKHDPTRHDPTRPDRGRQNSSKTRKSSRSLSPLRTQTGPNKPEDQNTKKWTFKDLLFRSASEGRATGDSKKDPLRKYTEACRKKGGAEEERSASFRCASPHAALYAANRAAAEEMKRKTALPYKTGFFSLLKFGSGLGGSGLGGPGFRGKVMGGSKTMPPVRDGK